MSNYHTLSGDYDAGYDDGHAEALSAVPLVGHFDKDSIREEIRFRIAEWNEEAELRPKLETLETMDDEAIRALHFRAGDALMDDLHQGPLSYIIDAIP